MKTAIRHVSAAVVILFSLYQTAHATELKVTPKIEAHCEKPTKRTAAFVDTIASTDNGEVTYTFWISYGTCVNGKATFKKIGSEANTYLVNREYSRDVKTVRGRAGDDTLVHQLRFSPNEFFQPSASRHFDLHFYPGADATVYGWNVTITRDPASNAISLDVNPL